MVLKEKKNLEGSKKYTGVAKLQMPVSQNLLFCIQIFIKNLKHYGFTSNLFCIFLMVVDTWYHFVQNKLKIDHIRGKEKKWLKKTKCYNICIILDYIYNSELTFLLHKMGFPGHFKV